MQQKQKIHSFSFDIVGW